MIDIGTRKGKNETMQLIETRNVQNRAKELTGTSLDESTAQTVFAKKTWAEAWKES